jgi:hypothetical protein
MRVSAHKFSSMQTSRLSIAGTITHRRAWLWISARRLALLAALVTLTGLGFRLAGIAYGLPYFYGPPDVEAVRTRFEVITPNGSDEPQFVNATMRLLANRSLNPEYFAQPGTPLMYMGVILYMGVLGLGMITGAIPSLDAASDLLYEDPTVYYLSFRLLVAVIGTATVPLVYLIGRRLFDYRAGLVAALIFAASPIHIYLSKVIRADALMILLLVAAFWFCLDIIERGTWRAYMLAGVFTGLAVVSKYPAAVFVLVVVAAHAMRWHQGEWDHRKLVAAGLATLAGAFIGSPYAFLDFPAVLQAVNKEAEPHLGGASEGLLGDALWYLRGALPNSVAPVGALLAGAGAALCLRSGDRRQWLLLIFPPLFLIFICTLGIRWERWLIPIIPFVCLWLGGAVSVIARQLDRVRRPLGTLAALGLAALMFLPLAQLNVSYARLLIAPETRTLARQWMIEHIPPGSRVLMERHGPQPPRDLFTYFEERRGVIQRINPQTRRLLNVYAVGELGKLHDLDQIAQEDIDYLVLTDYYARYLAEAHLYPDMIARYEEIRALGETVYEIFPNPPLHAGPHVTIVRLN